MFDNMASLEGPTDHSDFQPSLQRVKGHGRCTFKVRDGQTVLDTLGQSGSFKVRLPKLPDQSTPEAVLLNTAGGLTGGDALSFKGAVAAAGQAVFTTQACERAYRALSDTARVETKLHAGAGATLEWLPQETILFDGARLRRTFDVDLDEGATLLAHESVVFGRTAMGETIANGAFSDTWQIRREGRLIHADAIRIDGAVQETADRLAILGGAKAMASIVYIDSGAEQRLTSVRDVLAEGVGQFGVSAWAGKLVCRITASDSASLRQIVIPVLDVLRDGRLLPRVWSI